MYSWCPQISIYLAAHRLSFLGPYVISWAYADARTLAPQIPTLDNIPGDL